MKKQIVFLFIAVICIIIGCYSLKKNRPLIIFKDDDGIASLRTIPADDIKKIKMGMTMEEVRNILGNGMAGDLPTVSVRYFLSDGGGYDILFFELQDSNTLGEFKDSVTGIYYFKDFRKSNGYFLLPEAWKGKTWEEVMPGPRP